jgi:dihydrofolate reductase
MGEVVVSEFISLDGVMEDPGGAEDTPFGGWTFRFSAEEGQRLKYDELMAADVQLLGRVTYEEFAANWPAMEDAAGDFGAKMNAMPKVVVSNTLTDPSWNNTTVATGKLPDIVAGLKDTYQGNILVGGSATLIDALREHDLVDEYRLTLYPVILGQGKKLFKEGAPSSDLRLVESLKAGPDVQLLIYRPTNRDG